MSVRHCAMATAVAVALGVAAPSFAVLVPAAGPGTGFFRINHAYTATGAGGPGAVFNGFFNPATGVGGEMFAPGFNFPSLGVNVAQNNTGLQGLAANVPVTWNTPAGLFGLAPGFGGASTTIIGIAGNGRAGIVAPTFNVFDQGANGFASVNVFAAEADYVNVAAPVVGKFGHWLSGTAVAPVGGYVAAGVKSLIQVDVTGAVGAAFNPTFFWEPLPIIMAFDGVGVGNPLDAIQAEAFQFNAVGQGVTFAGVSTSPVLNIPAGASVRLISTITLVADPDATMSLIDLPLDLGTNFDLGGIGASTNADSFIPEPAALSFMLPAIGLLARRRK